MPSAPRKRFLSEEKRPPTRGEKIFGHAVLIVACILFPGFWMLVAPLTVIHLYHENGAVRAEVSKRVWFVLPYRHETVSPVTGVNNDFHAGEVNYDRSNSSGSYVRSEDEAYLILSGPGSSAKISVSPANVDSVVRQARDFIQDPGQPHLRLIAVSNWKFGVIAGGCLSLLTLCYLFILADNAVRALWRLASGGKIAKPPAAS